MRWVLLIVLPTSALADLPALMCLGESPDWSLRAKGVEAVFDYPTPQNFDIPQISDAQSGAWPKAATLIERDGRATAIVILDQAACDGGTHRAHILTQRGTEPVLLTGCCELR